MCVSELRETTRLARTYIMEARLALFVVALLASAPAGGANVFNAKNYGAKGNGVVDDSKVVGRWLVS